MLISLVIFIYQMDIFIIKQSQKSRPVLLDGTRLLDCFGREILPFYIQSAVIVQYKLGTINNKVQNLTTIESLGNVSMLAYLNMLKVALFKFLLYFFS